MSGPEPQERHRASVHAVCALGVVRRPVPACADARGEGRRARTSDLALADARRALGVVVALLRGSVQALQAWEDA